MTLTEILADLYRRLALPAVPNVTETTRLTSFVNTTHRQILGMPGLESLRDDTITFASVASQARYGLPVAVTRIEGITDPTTQIKLDLRHRQTILAGDPGLTATGTPDTYAVLGYQQVAIQPTTPTELFVKSTSASDTTQTVIVNGVRFGGYPLATTATLTGTTAVSLNALSPDAIEVTKCYLSAVAVGTVSLHQTSGAGPQLAAIATGSFYARYLGLQLYPTPSSVITYNVDYVRNVVEMTRGTDEPLLPDDFHWLLVEGALLKEWTKRDDDRRVAAEREYAKGISALKYFVTCQADDLPVSGRRTDWPTHSRYGAWYPAMRY